MLLISNGDRAGELIDGRDLSASTESEKLGYFLDASAAKKRDFRP